MLLLGVDHEDTSGGHRRLQGLGVDVRGKAVAAVDRAGDGHARRRLQVVFHVDLHKVANHFDLQVFGVEGKSRIGGD